MRPKDAPAPWLHAIGIELNTNNSRSASMTIALHHLPSHARDALACSSSNSDHHMPVMPLPPILSHPSIRPCDRRQ